MNAKVGFESTPALSPRLPIARTARQWDDQPQAYRLHHSFFHDRVDAESLERMFSRAAENAPSLILLEDIDRVFPRTDISESEVSLQRLLNCLDGVGTGEGTVVVATANEPTALDAAILRRRGRFGRMVAFPNPSS